jgi:hypothetical protein
MDKPKEPIDRQKDPPRPHGGNRNLDQLLTINLTKFLRHNLTKKKDLSDDNLASPTLGTTSFSGRKTPNTLKK